MLLAIVALVLLGAELALRVAIPTRRGSHIARVIRWHRDAPLDQTSIRSAAYVRWLPAMDLEGVNAGGFHSPEIPLKKKPGTLRVAFLGGSTTFNAGPLETTYPHFAMEFLTKRGVSADYLNVGTNGYSLTDSLVSYHTRVVPWDPDIVVVHHGRNDIMASGNRFFGRDLTRLATPANPLPPSGLHRRLASCSVLFGLTCEVLGVHAYRHASIRELRKSTRYRRDHGVSATMDEFFANARDDDLLEVFERGLEALAALTENRGRCLLILEMEMRPDRIASGWLPGDRPLEQHEIEWFQRRLTALNGIARQVAHRHENTTCVDIGGVLSDSDFVDDCHVNIEGRRKKGHLIGPVMYALAQELQPSGLIGGSAAQTSIEESVRPPNPPRGPAAT